MNTRYMTIQIGAWISSGRQPPSGLTLCSLYKAMSSSFMACRSPRCCCWMRFISGWIRCSSSIDLVLFSVSGVSSSMMRIVIMAMAAA